jgi:hypothetical protein
VVSLIVAFYELTDKGRNKKEHNVVSTIDLVLTDQQSLVKRSLHLMDTVNAKKRWTTI